MMGQEQRQVTKVRLKKYILMFQGIGTFLFAYGIGCASKQLAIDFIHSATLLLALAISGQVTGGYFNSSITIAAYFNKKHRFLIPYLSGQIIGGTLGALWYTLLLGNSVTPYVNQSTFQLIKFIINQFIGTFFFSICLLALTNRFTTHAYKSWQIYLSIAAAFYLVRKMTDCTPLNPTVSVPYQIISAIINEDLTMALNIWIIIVPSTIGAVFAGYFMLHIYEPLLLSIRFKQQSNQKQGDKFEDQITTADPTSRHNFK